MSQASPSAVLALVAAAGVASAQPFVASSTNPNLDRWMYPFNSTPGAEVRAPVFAALSQSGFDDRDSQMLVRFDTASQIPSGQPLSNYRVSRVRVQVTVSNTTDFVFYDPSADPLSASFQTSDPDYVADADAGTPIEIYGVGFRNGRTIDTFLENTSFGCFGFPVEGCRSVFAADFDSNGALFDISRHVRQKVPTTAWAIGTTSSLTAGQQIPVGTTFDLELDVTRLGIQQYVRQALSSGKLMLSLTSLHPASGGPGGGTSSDYPSFYTKEAPGGVPATILITGRTFTGADFNGDTVVDFFDYLDFVAEFAAASLESDFNDDGVIDFFDYLDFVAAFAG
ncbi:MAG: hypothetical protein KGS45_12240 [Planctomycetes bacterium]|nr:hypothetical protein [Planctomycetota bacterium]